MKRFAWAVLAMLAGGLVSCGEGSGGDRKSRPVTLKGSDTMVILGQRWAENYMNTHPGVTLQVTGGGSGTGIAALINGATDICMASRPMKDKEKKQAEAKFRKPVKEIQVALDGLAIYVHESSPLSQITLAQAKAIYTGKVTSWKDLGGPDKTIVTYGRENNSGTYMYFKEHVLDNTDFAAGVQTLPGTAAVVNAVSKDPNSIGYGGIGYSKGIKTLKVKKDDAAEAVEPTMDHVVSGKYPISRFLYFYTMGEPEGEARAFIDWCLSAPAQKICADVGYYPLKQ